MPITAHTVAYTTFKAVVLNYCSGEGGRFLPDLPPFLSGKVQNGVTGEIGFISCCKSKTQKQLIFCRCFPQEF